MTAPVSRTGATDREVEARDAAGREYFAGGNGGYVAQGETFDQRLVGPSVAFRAGWARSAEWHAARAAAAPDSGPRETTVDQLTASDFGLWVDVPERQTAGYLYVISDQYGDGYPSRVLTLVSGDSTTAPELEFTDADPASYPKTMRTPCLVLAEQPGGGR